jgi:hypothetical protein
MNKSNDVSAVRRGGNEPPAPARSPDQIAELPAEALEHLPGVDALPAGTVVSNCPYDPTCSVPGSWHWAEDAKD